MKRKTITKENKKKFLEKTKPHEWINVKLGDVANLLTGFPFKSNNYVEDEAAPRLLRGDNIVQGTLRWDGVKRWSKNAVNDMKDYWLHDGDVVLAMDRPWIEAGLKFASVRSTDIPSLLVQRVARMRGTDRLDTGFLKYVIGRPEFTNYVLAVQTGTAVPHISGGQIKEFEFSLPPIDEQRGIAYILSTLDDKIELNRRMNKTLETIGRAIFKHWFIELEFPNDEDKPYKSSGGEIVKTEIGEIPKLWKIDVSINLFKLEYGWHLPEWDRKEGNIPVYGSGGLTGFHNEVLVKGPGIILGRAGKIGKESIYYSHSDFCPLETTFYVEAKNKNSIPYLYFFLKTLTVVNTGSSVPNLSRTNIHNSKIIIPPTNLIQKFCNIVEPFFDLIHQNNKETRTLSQIRDSLLPKLMSGKIRVPVEA